MTGIDFKRILLIIYLKYFASLKQNPDNENEFHSKTLYIDEQINEVNLLNRDSIDIHDAIKNSINFYLENIEDADIGCVNLFEITLNSCDSVYMVRVTTDGDDGWIELYDSSGNILALGRTNMELIGFDDNINTLRSYVTTFTFPDSMDISKSKWDTPLPWTLDYEDLNVVDATS
jgi:hypothetical protein